MSYLQTATELLADALATVDGVRVHTDLADALDPPAVVVAMPRLDWATPTSDPTDATFLVIVAVGRTDRWVESLWRLVPLVTDALDALPEAAVIAARPGLWTSAGADLPCYELTVEVSL